MVDCGHHHAHTSNTRRLAWAFAVIAFFMVVEVIGGVVSGSLALLADAAHMMTDAFALGLAISAQHIAAKPADQRLHFGYRRAQVLAAFVNGLLLAALLCWIVVEAISRFANPAPIDAPLMLGVAVLGLLANTVAFAILHRRQERDLNMRGAVLHVIGDLLGSVAAIVAALAVMAGGWTRIDPILSILVAALIGVSALRLIRESGFILLEGAPAAIDVEALREDMQRQSPAILNAHHVRITQITPDHLRLTMHLCVEKDSDAAPALAAAKACLERRYGVSDSTIQVEVGPCLDPYPDPRAGAAPADGARDSLKDSADGHAARSEAGASPASAAAAARPAPVGAPE